MNCPECGTRNAETDRICQDCGARLPLFCSQCNTELPLEARFCFACGAELSAIPPAGPVPQAEDAVQRLQRLVPKEFAERLLASRGQVAPERRTITILFSDVKGSTTMAESLDPEDWMEIMDGAFDVLIEPVYRYEGTVARLMGDAILAFFGAPIAHEDDPERACRAALEIVKGGGQYAARLERERGLSGFNVRVGINTGLVVVGEVGSDLRVEYTAMGDAVNLAARMESAAEPGTVLITEDTHKLIAPLFDVEPVGSIELKGKAEPVPAYQVLASREVTGKPRGIAGLQSPLVGRGAEFRALQEALDQLQAGLGSIVLVAGEAGIGKSRLVAELRKEAQRLRGDGKSPRDPAPDQLHPKWVEGRCLSYGTSSAFLLWLDMMRGLLELTVEDTPGEVRDALKDRVQTLCPDRYDEVYPYLGRLMSLPLEEEVEAMLADLDGGQLRGATFEAVETLIDSEASEGPLVLVCEDLHWADPSSLALLERLLPLSGRLPLLLLCVYRPEREHRVWRLQEAVARDFRHHRIWLQSLSQDEGESLIDNLLGARGLPDALVERILGHAEGNPFYLEEVLRSLIGEGVIVQDMATGRWQATRDVTEITIPDTLQGVLLARIDRLQQETKRVLQMASVIGRIFLYRLLAEIAHEEQLLDRRLLSLQQAEMIRERARLPELEYIFKHHLTQEAAYSGLLKKERRIFHRHVGQALERLFHDRLEEQAGLLAYHWERARDAEKAVKYLQQAGDAARLAYAHEEAVDYYRRALAFQMEQRDHEGAGRTFMKLGLTFHSAFDYEASCQAYDEGFDLLQRAAQARPAVELPPAPHALRISLPDPSTLDPTRAAGLISNIFIDQLFSGLVELSPELDVLPDVANRWEVTDGGRKYVFFLRDDVCWSDGVPLTAQDFEYAWKRLLAPATGFLAKILFDIKGARAFHEGEAASADQVEVRALDDRTLQVMLEHPAAYFLQLLTSSMGRPVPRHAVDAHGESWTDLEHIVTCGPFRLESYEPGETMVLARDPDYHGRRSGNLPRVEVNHVTCWTDGGKLAAYEDGSLDIGAAYELPSRERHRARERHAGQYFQWPALWLDFIGFDARRSPFADVRVRRAFAMATDKQALADIYRRGWYVPATGGFVPPRMPGHSPDIGLPYDPADARRLLAEAGYPAGDGFPVVLAGKGGLVEEEVEHLSARWREVLGVEVEWLDQGDERRAQLFVTGWFPVYPDPDCMLRHAIPAPCTPGWRSEVYEGLVAQAGRLTDHGKRMKLYAQADTILMEEAAILPLFYGRMNGILKPWIKRYPLSPISFWFWKDIIIEPH